MYVTGMRKEVDMERDAIEQAIENLEGYPLTENQQRLVNYLRANIDDIEEKNSIWVDE